jgi:hypothetical protein
MYKVIFYADPGHGWLRVSRDIVTLAQSRGAKFSRFSYQSDSGKYVYLEEDCDVGELFKVIPKENFTIKYKHTNTSSSIRNYPRLI